MALSDEDRWHGSAEALGRKIENAVTELRELLGYADDILQSDQMPQPWELWQSAVDAAQDAWSDVSCAGDVQINAMIVSRALRLAGIDEWPPREDA